MVWFRWYDTVGVVRSIWYSHYGTDGVVQTAWDRKNGTLSFAKSVLQKVEK